MSIFVKLLISSIFVILPIPLYGSAAGVINNYFTKVYSNLSDIASPVLSSMSIDSSGKLFQAIATGSVEIETILRINSSGLVINEVASGGTQTPMRSVVDQKWFQLVKERMSAYHGTSRESGGETMLFWAWPITSGSGAFAGALAVKIAPERIMNSIGITDAGAIALSFNNQTIYQPEELVEPITEETVWVLSDNSRLVMYYSGREDINGTGQGASDTGLVDLRENGNNQVFVNDLDDDGMLYVEEPDIQKRGSGILFWVVVIIVLVTGWVFVAMSKKQKSRCSKAVHRSGVPVEGKSIDTTTESDVKLVDVEDELVSTEECSFIDLNENGEETVVSSISNVNDDGARLTAEEACEKIKSFITSDQSSKFRTAASTSESLPASTALRKELYREIHGQITHWVEFESSRLSKSLEELSDRVGRLEKGNTPEILRIRKEAQRISNEIALFKEKLPDEDL